MALDLKDNVTIAPQSVKLFLSEPLVFSLGETVDKI